MSEKGVFLALRVFEKNFKTFLKNVLTNSFGCHIINIVPNNGTRPAGIAQW
jgi:hypothetical protein